MCIEIQGFLDDFTEFREDLLFIATMTASIKQTRTTTDKALIFIRPLNDFHVAGTFAHLAESSMAILTALS